MIIYYLMPIWIVLAQYELAKQNSSKHNDNEYQDRYKINFVVAIVKVQHFLNITIPNIGHIIECRKCIKIEVNNK